MAMLAVVLGISVLLIALLETSGFPMHGVVASHGQFVGAWNSHECSCHCCPSSRQHSHHLRVDTISAIISHPSKYDTSLCMVRNIDLVEALIFYGKDSILEKGPLSSNKLSFLGGVEGLLQECRNDETSVIALLEDDGNHYSSDKEKVVTFTLENVQDFFAKRSPATIHTFSMTSPGAPSPKDIWTSIHSIPPIQPKGFGGSSGFGTKAADPERAPLPKHCVVLCSTEHQCRAARYAGMRVLCLTDNLLADAVLDDDWTTIYMDDIATPGSFWLNPPHPRDDEGNAVEVESVILAYEKQQDIESSLDGALPAQAPAVLSALDIVGDDELSDAELAKILADIDPL